MPRTVLGFGSRRSHTMLVNRGVFGRGRLFYHVRIRLRGFAGGIRVRDHMLNSLTVGRVIPATMVCRGELLRGLHNLGRVFSARRCRRLARSQGGLMHRVRGHVLTVGGTIRGVARTQGMTGRLKDRMRGTFDCRRRIHPCLRRVHSRVSRLRLRVSSRV